MILETTRSRIGSSGPGMAALLLLSIPALAEESSPASAPTSATYTVTFDATWSAQTHPIDFPPNPHFSPLIGGTHNDQVVFWEVGQLASLGIQRMAEWGSQTPLDEEVQAAIEDGRAESVITGGSINPSPGMVTTTLTLTQQFPLVTLVSMIAPSPDWFVGVSGLDLFAGGYWVPELVVDLMPYDAGTDSGPTYTSPNQPTVPHVPTYLSMEGPFAEGLPLGTFTFTLQDPPSAVPEAEGLAAWNHPNPFNPRTTVSFRAPVAGPLRLTVHDVRGGLVCTLLDRMVEAGEGRILWDGTDQAGKAAPAGVYLLRTTLLGQSTSSKLSLVR